SVVEPVTKPDVALIVVVPMLAPVARPLLPAALLTVATFALDEAHVTVAVRSCVEPSVYVPVAVNCCVVPAAMDGLVGVTARETSVAAVTVNVDEPDTEPNVALIVVVPAATPEARPLLPAALLTVAVLSFDE